MQEVATLIIRLKQCDLSDSTLPDPLLWQPETSQPTPTGSQWENIQTMACRVSAAMEWASSEAYRQLPGPDLTAIISLNHILVELLYKMIYVHALNEELNMTMLLR